ncbi:hypothetical protein [Mesorhizobium sp. SP-1A]|uniref:hypothetical protein n=1 Tax=Mesorhizobium sp. SP-1A TaxID=3077840 RepID=UPI0028F745CD|nr:hypothetical protein [Mesorhizobium sp. SP-1A]
MISRRHLLTGAAATVAATSMPFTDLTFAAEMSTAAERDTTRYHSFVIGDTSQALVDSALKRELRRIDRNGITRRGPVWSIGNTEFNANLADGIERIHLATSHANPDDTAAIVARPMQILKTLRSKPDIILVQSYGPTHGSGRTLMDCFFIGHSVISGAVATNKEEFFENHFISRLSDWNRFHMVKTRENFYVKRSFAQWRGQDVSAELRQYILDGVKNVEV